MDESFRLFPESASSIAGSVDALYLFLVAVSLFFTFLVCALILYFGTKYRRGSKAERGNPPRSMMLEISWSLLPLLISMVMFYWGAVVYFEMQTPPADARDIEVVGKQWMWKVQHSNGKSEINALHVSIGKPVRLRMISEDVIHSFYVPAFRLKQDVLPSYYTHLWFTPTKIGTYHLFCAEYCGTEHSLMRGTVTVMSETDYAHWLSGEIGEAPEVTGGSLFEKYRCASCHKHDGTGNGPSLVNLFGKSIPLQSGGMVTADEQYVRDSILNPRKQIVAGYQPLMPSYQGQLSESDVLTLIAYLKTLSQTQVPAQ